MADEISEQSIECSFCRKSQDEACKLIAGPGVYICDECIFLCTEILEEECEQLFYDRADAARFIGHMQSIERIDTNSFRQTCAYIKGVLDGLRIIERQIEKNHNKK